MDKETIFTILILITFILIFVIKNLAERFFFITLFVILCYMYYERSKKGKIKNMDKNNLLSNISKELGNDFEVTNSPVFFIHKTPRSLKFINKHDELKNIVYNLKFLQIYDRALYNRIIICLEYYLKIHYKVMLGKYDFNLYYPMLVDVRNEILNDMKSVYFNIPTISTIIDIDNLDNYVEKHIRLVQSITYKLLKILCNKYGKDCKPPFGFDKIKDDHFSLF